jgi:O-antigen/teichoic acid export membrane protein
MTELRQKVISSFMWLSSLTFLGQAVTWVITLVVIRLLEPKDYGLMAMASVFIGFLTILNELGLGPAIIQKPDLTEHDMRKANGCVLVINIILCAAVFALAPLIAWFFHEPRLVAIIRVLGLSFILISFYFLPQSLMTREMDFKTRSIIELGGNLVSSLIVLVLALDGFGVWALVLGPIGMHLFKVAGFNAIKRYRYRVLLSARGMRGMLAFGGYVSVARVFWYFYSQADILICGKIFGKTLLGIYSVAMQLVSIPMNKLSPMLSQIGFSAFSKIQANLASVQANFLRLIHLISLVSFPLFWGLAMVAPQAIPWLLGAKWHSVILPIQLLSIVMPLRFISTMFSPVISSYGRPDVTMQNMVAALIIMPAAFYIGAHWGILGLCLAWVIAFPLLFVYLCYSVLRVLQIPFLWFAKACWLPCAASGVMVAGLELLNRLVIMRVALSVIASILLGTVLYASVTLILNRNELVEIRSMFAARS